MKLTATFSGQAHDFFEVVKWKTTVHLAQHNLVVFRIVRRLDRNDELWSIRCVFKVVQICKGKGKGKGKDKGKDKDKDKDKGVREMLSRNGIVIAR